MNWLSWTLNVYILFYLESFEGKITKLKLLDYESCQIRITSVISGSSCPLPLSLHFMSEWKNIIDTQKSKMMAYHCVSGSTVMMEHQDTMTNQGTIPIPNLKQQGSCWNRHKWTLAEMRLYLLVVSRDCRNSFQTRLLLFLRQGET